MPSGHPKTTWGGKKVNNFRPQKIIYFFLFFLFYLVKFGQNLGRIWQNWGRNLGRNPAEFEQNLGRIGSEFGQNLGRIKPFQTFSNIFKHFWGAPGGGVARRVLGTTCLEMFENVWKCLKMFEKV